VQIPQIESIVRGQRRRDKESRVHGPEFEEFFLHCSGMSDGRSILVVKRGFTQTTQSAGRELGKFVRMPFIGQYI
jgi:hypothetical protein